MTYLLKYSFHNKKKRTASPCAMGVPKNLIKLQSKSKKRRGVTKLGTWGEPLTTNCVPVETKR